MTPSTISDTQFCGARIVGPKATHLWIDGSGKITAGNGTLEDPRPNALSLVQVQDCPFATTTCKKACYVHGIEEHLNPLHKMYQHNSTVLRHLTSVEVVETTYAQDWAVRLGQWIRGNAEHGFRWHVSGDIMSKEHARWMRWVMEYSRAVPQWVYTRSFDYIHPLVNARNLSINLSCDVDNYAAARATRDKYPGRTRLAYLTVDGAIPDDLPDDSVIFPDYALRGETPRGNAWFAALEARNKAMTCPVDAWGKSEERRCGPCNRCIKPNE